MAASGTMETNLSNGTDTFKLKAEQKKRSDLISEIRKLNFQIQALERERETHIFSKRSDFRKDFASLEETDTKLLKDRNEEYRQMSQQLCKMSHMIKRFQKELTSIRPTPEFVEKLKTAMEEIEGSINAFKDEQKCKYGELLREECVTHQEVCALERKFSAWSEEGDAPVAMAPNTGLCQHNLVSASDIIKDLPPEVAAFEKFLQQTRGHRGGWDEYDHGMFLKFRNRHKGRIVFLDHLKGVLPAKTEEEIREHEIWYQEYLFLNERKKDIIKDWRQKREEQKGDLLSKAREGQDNENTEHDANRQQLQEIIEMEKQERFSKLNAWKVQKELEKAVQEERKMREMLAKAKKAEEDHKRQAEVRVRVEEFRKQREQEEEFVRQQEEFWKRQEEDSRRQISTREIVKFRSRDQQQRLQKMAREAEKQSAETARRRQLDRLRSQVEPHVERDPSRLLQPTAGWEARVASREQGSGGRVLHMPHRAIPSWRKQ